MSNSSAVFTKSILPIPPDWANKLYIFGGRNNTTFYNDLRSYNPVSKIWSTLSQTEAPSVRAGHTAIWDNSKERMLVFGGYDGANYFNSLYAVDLTAVTSATWAEIITSPCPPKRQGHSAVWDATNKKMYIYGGYDGTTYLNDLWCFDATNDTWQQLNSSSSGRYYHSAVWDDFNNRMLVFGGLTASGKTEQLLAFYPDKNNGSGEWETLQESNETTNPSFGSTATLVNGKNMALIGGFTADETQYNPNNPPAVTSSSACASYPGVGWYFGTSSIVMLTSNYYNEGDYISPYFDPGVSSDFIYISSEAIVPSGDGATNPVKFQIQLANPGQNFADCPWIGSDGVDTYFNGSGYIEIPESVRSSFTNNKRYIRFKLLLSTDNSDYAPKLKSFTVNYQTLPAITGEAISVPITPSWDTNGGSKIWDKAQFVCDPVDDTLTLKVSVVDTSLYSRPVVLGTHTIDLTALNGQALDSIKLKAYMNKENNPYAEPTIASWEAYWLQAVGQVKKIGDPNYSYEGITVTTDDNVNFLASSSIGENLEYSYIAGDTHHSQTPWDPAKNNATFNYPEAGTYTAKIQVRDKYNTTAVSTDEITVTVNPGVLNHFDFVPVNIPDQTMKNHFSPPIQIVAKDLHGNIL
ncbi:MAG: hypothetical protein NT030_06950, partial [Candidatus Saganbacteria bacterium]|nr:hypothetical protein [Candidatus Saganbacteria bacterium]